jgi:hypothetical protein
LIPIILTMQSNGSGGMRLGISSNDSRNIFKCRKVIVLLHFPNIETIKCRTACGNPIDENGEWISINPKTQKPYRKKGFDLNKKELSKWLLSNFKKTTKAESIKLKFNLEKIGDTFCLYFKGT